MYIVNRGDKTKSIVNYTARRHNSNETTAAPSKARSTYKKKGGISMQVSSRDYPSSFCADVTGTGVDAFVVHIHIFSGSRAWICPVSARIQGIQLELFAGVVV